MDKLKVKNGSLPANARKKNIVENNPDIDKVLDLYASKKLTFTSPGYTLGIENESGVILDEIVVFYQTTDGLIHQESQTNILNVSYRTFDLGLCNQLQSYVIGVYVGNVQVIKYPPSGSLTPQQAQTLNPNNGPCNASFTIY